MLTLFFEPSLENSESTCALTSLVICSAVKQKEKVWVKNVRLARVTRYHGRTYEACWGRDGLRTCLSVPVTASAQTARRSSELLRVTPRPTDDGGRDDSLRSCRVEGALDAVDAQAGLAHLAHERDRLVVRQARLAAG